MMMLNNPICLPSLAEQGDGGAPYWQGFVGAVDVPDGQGENGRPWEVTVLHRQGQPLVPTRT
jgi:hypothetical protein